MSTTASGQSWGKVPSARYWASSRPDEHVDGDVQVRVLPQLPTPLCVLEHLAHLGASRPDHALAKQREKFRGSLLLGQHAPDHGHTERPLHATPEMPQPRYQVGPCDPRSPPDAPGPGRHRAPRSPARLLPIPQINGRPAHPASAATSSMVMRPYPPRAITLIAARNTPASTSRDRGRPLFRFIPAYPSSLFDKRSLSFSPIYLLDNIV